MLEMMTKREAVVIFQRQGVPEANRLSLKALTTVWRKLRIRHHPDKGGSTRIAQDINAAFDVLKLAAATRAEPKSKLAEPRPKFTARDPYWWGRAKPADWWKTPAKYANWSHEDENMSALELVSLLLEGGPRMDSLKKGKTKLSDTERAQAMKAGAVWHPGNHAEPTCAIWKSVVNGTTWYVCNTHRAYQAKKSLKGAINAFKFIKTTA